jgi:hypothetical protein
MSHPLPRYTNTTHADLQKIARITQDHDPHPTTTTSATLPGDQRRLRGIPVQARGVTGTSPGTNPATETERRNP